MKWSKQANKEKENRREPIKFKKKTYRIFQKTEKSGFRAFMVVQGLRTCLPMYNIQVPFLVRKIPHASGQLSQ